jgi:hypothetical protein
MIDVGAVSYLIKMLLTLLTTINEVASKGFYYRLCNENYSRRCFEQKN